MQNGGSVMVVGYSVGDVVKTSREELWPGVPKGTEAVVVAFDGPNGAVTLDISGRGSGLVTHERNVDLVHRVEPNFSADAAGDAVEDEVEHPPHYTSHPSGVECITIAEHMTFNVGNAVKYLWRQGLKNEDALTDLRKAEFYVRREIQRLESQEDGT